MTAAKTGTTSPRRRAACGRPGGGGDRLGQVTESENIGFLEWAGRLKTGACSAYPSHVRRSDGEPPAAASDEP
jgi:hypothetical protein